MMKYLTQNIAQGHIDNAAWVSLLFAIVVVIYTTVFTGKLMDPARKKYVVEEGRFLALYGQKALNSIEFYLNVYSLESIIMADNIVTVGEDAKVGRGVRVWIVKNSVFLLILAVILFGGSGQLDWGMGWAYFLLMALFIALDGIVLYGIDPSLLSERSGPQKGSKGWDLPLASMISVWLPLAICAVAALGQRYGWTPTLPIWLQIIGLVSTAFGAAVVLWAMATNRYFSAVVRIQEDRGHHVVSTGPYRIVRHPAYASILFYDVGAALALGSAWALVPAFLIVVLAVIRTVLEDRMLQKELPGYREYAAKVRYRLVPGLW